MIVSPCASRGNRPSIRCARTHCLSGTHEDPKCIDGKPFATTSEGGVNRNVFFGVEKSFVICDLKIANEKSATKDAQKYVTRLSLPARRSLSWSSPAFSKPVCLMLPLSRTNTLNLSAACLAVRVIPAFPCGVSERGGKEPSPTAVKFKLL